MCIELQNTQLRFFTIEVMIQLHTTLNMEIDVARSVHASQRRIWKSLPALKKKNYNQQ